MLRLPSLSIAGKSLRIPITDSAGWKLAALLVEPTHPELLWEVAQLVRDEPALLVWGLSFRSPVDATIASSTIANELLSRLISSSNDWQSVLPAEHSPWTPFFTEAKQLSEHLPQLAKLLEDSLPQLAAEMMTEDHNPESPSRILARVLTGIIRRRREVSEQPIPFDAAVERAKHQALYQFAYGLSHEINNPLANIASRAQTLLQDEVDPERKKRLATINAQAFRAYEMLADLMLYAKPPSLKYEATQLDSLLTKLIADLQSAAASQQTKLQFVCESAVLADCDPIQISVAVRALIRNSFEALQHGGEVVVRLSADQNHARIQVQDNGPGIPAEHRSHLFDPFFSGREAGRGLGLGLSKAWRITELHHGTLGCCTPAAGGTLFTLQLPLEGRKEGT